METISLDQDKKNAQRLKAHLAFADECGFLLIPNVRRTWAPRGQTPIVRHRYQRDKVSAISAGTVSAERRRVGLYLLRALLRHLRGHVIVVLDRGSIHKGPDVRALQARCPRLHLEWFPGYAPELNPDELVWAHFKAKLANGHPDTVDELMATLCRITKHVTKRPDLIRSFIAGSELPAFL